MKIFLSLKRDKVQQEKKGGKDDVQKERVDILTTQSILNGRVSNLEKK